MVKVGLLARLEAKPGKEAAVKGFLEGALSLANDERGTTLWFALQFGPTTFGIFDAFEDDASRHAHLEGLIAKALMGKAADLLTGQPVIEQVDIFAAKTPR
jgi:quinol monooxygenase YgiN